LAEIGDGKFFFVYFDFAQKVIKKWLFSLHLVFLDAFREFQTQLSPTEAGLESTFSKR
jgi:hypothetical protein